MRHILIVALVTSLVGTTAHASDHGGTTTAGVEGTQIMAGVQFGSPPDYDRDACEWSPTLPRDAGNTMVEEVTRPIGATTYRLYDYTCEGREPPTTYHWIPEVSSTTLANQASAVVYDNIPAPWGEFAPPAFWMSATNFLAGSEESDWAKGSATHMSCALPSPKAPR